MAFPEMSISDWLEYGLKHKFCGPVICFPHDGFPSSLEEDAAYDSGDDPCMHMLRLYEDDVMAGMVEENHSPSQWRKPYRSADFVESVGVAVKPSKSKAGRKSKTNKAKKANKG